jgi:hypothetical protein
MIAHTGRKVKASKPVNWADIEDAASGLKEGFT